VNRLKLLVSYCAVCWKAPNRAEALLPLGRRWPEGPDEGAFGARGVEKVAPHQFGQMTYGRSLKVCACGSRSVRGRKSWPHILSPEGRGGGARPSPSSRPGPEDWRYHEGDAPIVLGVLSGKALA